jgi:membrane protein DedA with SNARE-associated domain
MIGRMGGPAMIAALNQHPGRAAIIERARTTLQRWGPLGVFFSTWLVAPLGPWVNLIAGATGLEWWRFAIWDAAGEAIWVTIYVSLGFAFGTNLEALTDVVGNWAGFISAATTAIAVGLFLITQVRKRLS